MRTNNRMYGLFAVLILLGGILIGLTAASVIVLLTLELSAQETMQVSNICSVASIGTLVYCSWVAALYANMRNKKQSTMPSTSNSR